MFELRCIAFWTRFPICFSTQFSILREPCSSLICTFVAVNSLNLMQHCCTSKKPHTSSQFFSHCNTSAACAGFPFSSRRCAELDFIFTADINSFLLHNPAVVAVRLVAILLINAIYISIGTEDGAALHFFCRSNRRIHSLSLHRFVCAREEVGMTKFAQQFLRCAENADKLAMRTRQST